jgi:8-oxo-dGTP pyrophosphatase MutT (NUDIX family)
MSVSMWSISALEIVLEPGAAPALPPGGEQAWREMCDANPRLFDGAIYRTLPADAQGGHLRVALDSYQRLAIQDHPAVGDLGVRLLGVKAVITGEDAAGRAHVLIARRHPHTRSYGGMWEVAPGGSVGPGDVSPAALSEPGLLAHLAREAEEELGVDLVRSTAHGERGLWLLKDEAARSVDVVFHRAWRGAIDPRGAACRREDRDWEYVDTAWLALADLPAFVSRSPEAISPATVVIFGRWSWL